MTDLPHRKSARILLLNKDDDILMVKYEEETLIDPQNPEVKNYWVLPGGGMEVGESFKETAERELKEESGISAEIGRWIWTCRPRLIHQGELTEHEQHIFLAKINDGRVWVSNSSDEPIASIRWWSLDQMKESSELFFPNRLIELTEQILGGDIPQEPIEIAG